MKYITVDKETLNNLTEKVFETKTFESTVHPFFDKNSRKVFKLFKKGIDVDNKIKKIILLNDRLKNIDFVVTAESIVIYNDKPIGYIMPYVDGKIFDSLTFRKKDNILVLKDIAQKLKELHNLGIICGDLINNIMVDSDKNVYFIDHDNFSVDNLSIDTKTLLLKDYEKKIKIFDYKFDNYLLNLITLEIITKIHTQYLKLQYTVNYSNFNFKDNEINEIVRNTFNLGESYDEDLIVNKIESNKDFKKIKTRFF